MYIVQLVHHVHDSQTGFQMDSRKFCPGREATQFVSDVRDAIIERLTVRKERDGSHAKVVMPLRGESGDVRLMVSGTGSAGLGWIGMDCAGMIGDRGSGGIGSSTERAEQVRGPVVGQLARGGDCRQQLH